MSLLLVDSFDGYTTAELANYWTDLPITFPSGISTATFRSGTAAMNPSSFGVQRTFISPGSLQAVVVGFAFNPTVLSVQMAGLLYVGTLGTSTVITTTTVAELFVQADGALRLKREIGGPADVAKGSPKYALQSSGKWRYIEWSYHFGASALNELRVDGQVAFSANINTVGTETLVLGVNNLLLFGNQASSFFDDLYICSSDGGGVCTPIGDSAVRNLMPTADGSFTEWTPGSNGTSTGTIHFNRVNEIPFNGDTTYNESGTASGTYRDSYKVSTSIIANSDVVIGAQLVQVTKNATGTGTTTLSPIVIVNGVYTSNTHNDFIAPGGYIPQLTEYDRDPSGAGTNTWTGTTINQTEWGILKV